MNIKTIIGYLFLIAFTTFVGSYFVFSNNRDLKAESTLETVTPSDAANVGDDILSLLSQIKSLSIDAKIFENPVYTSLVDYTVQIPKQNLGRPNPFAPFGSGNVVAETAPVKKIIPKPSTGI